MAILHICSKNGNYHHTLIKNYEQAILFEYITVKCKAGVTNRVPASTMSPMKAI